jgi:uncharacterized protein YcnI
MMRFSKFVMALAAMTFADALVPASAHVTATPNEGIAGTYFQTAFTVPHGCSGSPTIALRVKIPEGVISIKPQVKPGWQIEIKNRKLDTPIDAGHGNKITETVDEVAWRGGQLPDIYYDTYGLVMKLPDTAGKTIYFPFVQECKEGVHRWITIPAAGQKWHEVKEPAPFIRLKAGPH